MEPLIQSKSTLLNLGLIIGTFSALVMTDDFKSDFPIKPPYAILVFLGGFIMGVALGLPMAVTPERFFHLSPTSHFPAGYSSSSWYPAES